MIGTDGRTAPEGSITDRMMPECGLIPGVVLPAAILLAPTPYLGVFAIAYVILTALGDAWFPDAGTARQRSGASRMGDFWLFLFGAELICFLAVAFVAAAPGTMPPWQFLGLVFTGGLIMGVNFNVSHDLIHRLTNRWKWGYGYFLLMLSLDSQLSVSHVYGHHANVGTEADPATARRGETLYGFFVRSSLGQYREACEFEEKRLHRHGRHALSPRNRVLTGALGSMAVCALVWVGFGGWALLFYLAACLIGKFFYESAQYIQHYGLVRVPRKRVQPGDSWDCSGAASRFFMFNQSYHSNHHLYANRRCWELRFEERAVRMPHGYVAMMFAAAVPPLWFRLADPLLDRRLAERASSEGTQAGGSNAPYGAE